MTSFRGVPRHAMMTTTENEIEIESVDIIWR